MRRIIPLIAFFIPLPIYAAAWGNDCVKDTDVPTIQCLDPLLGNVVAAVLALSGVGLFVMLLTGGYKYLLSGGDQKKLEAARGTLTSAITGLVIIVVAFLIIKTISVFTGATTVTQFTVPPPGP
ncbi:hypothetical protein A2973_02715 [Candidatus Gottesmanbacteria bacterium RIFCSPLOWO2_01_FULL_49_10]|uniref:Uncharacterized protein n=1 Tax=Candidatus Gottesmanbacteria bacterium RIFCSPLOWO2_01_FULL_49_10 TaxID=1798396 RepID=A0A1F6B1K1_9BACT|nr:MAG: hypothetical protein UY10_C0004G0033 [Microgenomates group bacterium GW2011_GWA2_47_8]OGG30811.1 MAG: hypothetical protein A2973_02715 [Candidatus Gottesmanbacteria bacterium RIFCSPLOWO2_01_FULL_49_10]